jgi:hypothetical protein
MLPARARGPARPPGPGSRLSGPTQRGNVRDLPGKPDLPHPGTVQVLEREPALRDRATAAERELPSASRRPTAERQEEARQRCLAPGWISPSAFGARSSRFAS